MVNKEVDILVNSIGDLSEHYLADRFEAFYKIGSLAHGGFSDVSDIDCALILKDEIIQEDLSKIRKLLEEISKLSDNISLFWGSISSINSREGGRFPPIDIVDLAEYGILLKGKDIKEKIKKPNKPAQGSSWRVRGRLRTLPQGT